MADVDPRDYMDTYVVEVKPSALGETSLSKDDFREDQHQVILSRTDVGGELRVEFTTRQGAEKLIDQLNYTLDAIKRGKLLMRKAHPSDASDADAYLLFKPRGDRRR